MRTILLCTILATVIFRQEIHAQKKTISILVGGGFSYVHSKGDPVSRDSTVVDIVQKFSAVLTPRADINLDIPVAKKVSFETGFAYQQKGFQSVYRFNTKDRSFRSSYESSATTRIHYLRIPVSVEYTLFKINTSRMKLGIGMDYGFAFKAKAKGYFENSYPATGEVSRNYYETDPEIKLMAGENRLANFKDYWASLFMFDVSFACSLQYSYKDKYLFRAFHTASLYPHSAREDQGITSRLRYTGVMIGYTF